MDARPEARATLVEALHQDPRQHGLPHGRYRLGDVRTLLPAVADYSLSGSARLLARWRIRLKRGRYSLASPDPDYRAKCARLAEALAQARQDPPHVRLLYVDECSVYRQPTLAPVWWPVGATEEPTVPRSLRSNVCRRYVGALDAVTGQVTWLERARMRAPALCAFLEVVRQAYPDQHLTVAWDNWTVHRHPRVLETAARPQIRLLWLPTYAPWTNPIEKLWRWLRQDVIHGHRLAEDWDALRHLVAGFLDQFARGSPALLRYVGLIPE